MRRYVNYRHYLIADPRFYEEYGKSALPYELERDLRDFAGSGDAVVTNGIWAIFKPANLPDLPQHGWKIHVTATPANARTALSAVLDAYRQSPFHFKVLRDEMMVLSATSRAWPTGQVGKIITIYTNSPDECRDLLALLKPLLEGIVGPYILTDKRYDGCLYYRYGEFTSLGRVDAEGNNASVLIGPDGEEWEDDRKPVYRKPPWADDLFPVEPPKPVDRIINGYKVTRALQHSGVGGVYLAERVSDGKEVLLKEARPNSGFAVDGSSRQDRLYREFEALTILKGTGIAPEPYEIFQAWEHVFLAEEYLKAIPLMSFLASRSPLAVGDPGPEVVREHEELMESILGKIRDAINACHERGIGYGDLSLTNVFVDPESLHVWLIDFESMQKLDGWSAELPATPGFTPRNGTTAMADGREFDHFGLSAIELAMIFPRNVLRDLDERILVRSTAHAASLLGRTDLSDLFTRLALPEATSPPDLDTAIKESLRFIEGVITPDRTDRVFPADPGVFTTNPWSVAYGIAGVVRALHRLTGDIPTPLTEWVERRHQIGKLPAGLCYGAAGAGWTLLEAGYPELGRELIDQALSTTDGLPAHLALGKSGVGLAALAAWLRTGEASYLDSARKLADEIIADATDDGTGLHWPSGGKDPDANGTAHGSSGVALFLLYLSKATKEKRYLHIGRRALKFEIAQLTDREDGGIWLPGQIGTTVFEPYWEAGGSGFGSTLARYAHVTGNERLHETGDKLVRSLLIGTAINPGLYVGMSGIVNFALDCHQFLGSEDYYALATKYADGILSLASEQPEGIVFPGHGLLRFSTDFATGNAGIALTLDRLRSRGGDFHYTLDELLR